MASAVAEAEAFLVQCKRPACLSPAAAMLLQRLQLHLLLSFCQTVAEDAVKRGGVDSSAGQRLLRKLPKEVDGCSVGCNLFDAVIVSQASVGTSSCRILWGDIRPCLLLPRCIHDTSGTHP